MLRELALRWTVLPLTVLGFTTLAGCRMGAPIHVWTPAALHSTVGKSVLVPDIVGPAEIAEPMQQQLFESAPTDQGRVVKLLNHDDIESKTAKKDQSLIAQVSYEAAAGNDLAAASTAKREGIDFILRGEILPAGRSLGVKQKEDRMTVSWKLTPVGPNDDSGDSHSIKRSGRGKTGPLGRPIVIDLETAIERYPDLALATDPQTAMRTASVREAMTLIAPSVQRDRVQIEIPYLTPGSRAIRQGNVFARAGRWAEAETIWKQVTDKFPFSSVAVHNLAIAAVAKQDFSTARKLSRKAVRMKPTKLHQRTLAWVEQTQRAFHEAFDLPDPPEGWAITR